MYVCDYIVDFFINIGISDAFGVPGGAILDLMYAINERAPIINAHLCYHEQSAAFAASGYAQSTGRIGLAYSTKGPGFTNLITGIADAFYESTPIFFVTAHAEVVSNNSMRCELDQEMTTTDIVKTITKLAIKIDTPEEIVDGLSKAYESAISGRKGPVFIDVNSKIFKMHVPKHTMSRNNILINEPSNSELDTISKEIIHIINRANRPILLIGDGINQCQAQKLFNILASQWRLPVISSRCSSDIVIDKSLYYGYIGSHGIRYANFILSKTDCIIALGNRLAVPVNSKSFGHIINNINFVRIDIDKLEFLRKIPKSKNYNVNLKLLIPHLMKYKNFQDKSGWIEVCNYIKKELENSDVNEPVKYILMLLNTASCPDYIVCDVGNNEYWVSRAFVKSNKSARVIYSKSFGALGCGLGKAIGTFYATKKSVILFIGDQGLQMNIQELQFIQQHQLPITIVLVNNKSSGMIKDRQKNRDYLLHTTISSGYSCPNWESIAKAYNIQYIQFNNYDVNNIKYSKPQIIEINISEEISLEPYLPQGNLCQDLFPRLDESMYANLNDL